MTFTNNELKLLFAACVRYGKSICEDADKYPFEDFQDTMRNRAAEAFTLSRKVSSMINDDEDKDSEEHANDNAEYAREFVKAIETIAEKPDCLKNLQMYLTYNFNAWLEKFANTPESIASEMKEFAEMELVCRNGIE